VLARKYPQYVVNTHLTFKYGGVKVQGHFAIFSVPNGEKREVKVNKKTGAKYCPAGKRLKKEGQRRGVPDLIMPIVRKYPGLYIEMKTESGTVSAEQKSWIAFLKSQGYRVEVCWFEKEAIAVIENYLK
jgi:hypothetical protein